MIGAVLAGGRSSRFGSDKAAYVWNGQTLLEWALAGLADFSPVVIGGQSNPDPTPFLGALYGLARALELGERIAATACDMPNLSVSYWHFLEQYNADVVIPKNQNGQLEPLAAIYSSRCLPVVQAALEQGRLQLSGWWQNSNLSVRVVPWADLEPHFGAGIFLNANRAEDLP
ncbi:MAG: molybdenum cofactor guanylyltransferase [Deinococcales bacterium]